MTNSGDIIDIFGGFFVKVKVPGGGRVSIVEVVGLGGPHNYRKGYNGEGVYVNGGGGAVSKISSFLYSFSPIPFTTPCNKKHPHVEGGIRKI